MKKLRLAIILGMAFSAFSIHAHEPSSVNYFLGSNSIKPNYPATYLSPILRPAKLSDLLPSTTKLVIGYEDMQRQWGTPTLTIEKGLTSSFYTIELKDPSDQSHFLVLAENGSVLAHANADMDSILNSKISPSELTTTHYMLLNGVPTPVLSVEASQVSEKFFFSLSTDTGLIEIDGILCPCERTNN